MRQAMMIGTDMETILKTIWTEGGIQAWPFNPGLPTSIYTPVKDLPAENKLLFDYNPDLAKQMIIDAGYPEGLEVNLYITPHVEVQDTAALLVDMWEKI
ncbi:unnamed protein product, partial [marine sediment metagenome]